MRYNEILFVAAIFLCSSAVALGQKASTAPALHNQEIQTRQILRRIAASTPTDHARRINRRFVNSARPMHNPTQLAISGAADAAPPAVNLEQDLKFLEQRQSGLAQCILAADVQVPAEGFAGSMLRRTAFEF